MLGEIVGQNKIIYNNNNLCATCCESKKINQHIRQFHNISVPQ